MARVEEDNKTLCSSKGNGLPALVLALDTRESVADIKDKFKSIFIYFSKEMVYSDIWLSS